MINPRSAGKLLALLVAALLWLGLAVGLDYLSAVCLEFVWRTPEPPEVGFGAALYVYALPAFGAATLLLFGIVYGLLGCRRWQWGAALVASTVPLPLLPMYLPSSVPKWCGYGLLALCVAIQLTSGAVVIWSGVRRWLGST